MTETIIQQMYRLQLTVNRMRQTLYTTESTTAFEVQLAELAAAEMKLAALEQQLPASAGKTLLVNNRQPTSLLGADTTGLEVEIALKLAHVPTGVYHLFEVTVQPLLACRVRNATTNKTKRVRVVAQIEGYSAQAIATFELKPKVTHNFTLLPTLFPMQIAALHELTRATLNILVQDLDGPDELQQTELIWLLARNSAPLGVKDPETGMWQDLSRYFGAYITPNAPEIRAFLRKVVAHHPEERLEGYHRAGDGPQEVEKQVKAIFNALKHDAGIAYVDSIVTNNPDEGASSQRVRLPSQSLPFGQANCIDATVLFASLLEAISMNPAIVIVPNHVLLAWETGPATDEWDYLEATKIHSHEFEKACDFGRTFAKGYQQRLADTGDERYFRRWSVQELRTKYGITPMA